jgi:hypothetical protein
MATTTPNYGWTVPTSTDLVKDGATAIETLGDAIDASMNTALGTKKAGMVLLNTTSFSGVASQNFPTVFSATYDSYFIVFTFHGSTGAKAAFRVSSGSSPVTTSTYAFKTILSGTNSDSILQTRNAAGSYLEIGDIASGAAAGFVGGSMTVSNPFTANRTGVSGSCRAATTGDVFFSMFGGENSNTVSYDGFALTCSTGNITGFASVYGFNK